MIPYGIIADCFKNKTIVPFLGAGASFVGAPIDVALPTGSQLARLLARKSNYPGRPNDALTKIAQYVEEGAGDRQILLEAVSKLFNGDVREDYECAFMRFLNELRDPIRPSLIVTTNYDTLVERVLQKSKVPYVALCQVVNGPKRGRFVYYSSLEGVLTSSSIVTIDQVNETLEEMEQQHPGSMIIYKIHGTARMLGDFAEGHKGETIDSIVLTENDYIDFLAQDRWRKIPVKILEILRVARLLFLGYSLEDWNFRVLLRKMSLLQQDRNEKRHWACLLETEAVEVGFWEKRGVNVYNCQLDEFLLQLGKALSDDNQPFSGLATL